MALPVNCTKYWSKNYSDTKNKDTTRKVCPHISHEYTQKHPQQDTSKLNPVYKNCVWKQLYIMTKWDLSQKSKVDSTSENVSLIHFISRKKDKTTGSSQ